MREPAVCMRYMGCMGTTMRGIWIDGGQAPETSADAVAWTNLDTSGLATVVKIAQRCRDTETRLDDAGYADADMASLVRYLQASER